MNTTDILGVASIIAIALAYVSVFLCGFTFGLIAARRQLSR
jgi:hypothetical protein